MTKQLRHVMIDNETLDLVPSSKIVSIGAVIFDPRYGKISDDTFYVELDLKAQKGRTEDHSVNGTVAWWKKQTPEVRKALKGTTLLEDALEDLEFWLPDDCKVWGNGSIFDIAMLEDAYRQYEMKIPWEYWNIRDMRTIKDMYESSRGSWEKGYRGTKHNALEDAKYQAEMVIKMWKSLLSK